MTFLRSTWCFGVAAFLSLGSAFAQISPAEQLLPDDTIGVLTIPDWRKFSTNSSQTAWGQLWNDAAMKPFRENFISNFQADFLKPLEKQLGIKLADYQDLLQGQITLALTVPKEGTMELLDVLLLIDSKEKSEVLASKLGELKKKWSDSGKTVQSEKIRDVEFNSIAFTSKDVQGLLKKAFPGDEDDQEEEEGAKKEEKIQLRIGQYKSLLIVGENSKVIEKLLARLSGGLVPPLAEKAAYQRAHTQLFRDSVGHAWVNVKPLYERLLAFAQREKKEPTPGMPAQMEKILPALGFSSIESIAAKIGGGPEGSTFEFLVAAPEGQREGIVKLLTLDKKDAAPPAFVPADVTKFQRTRIDAQKAWTTLEAMLSKIDPGMAGAVQLMLSIAGKDKDPNFDLKKSLIGNLGDDFIQYEKAPKSVKLEDLAQVPSLTLIGSPNPSQLLDALRMITSLMPPPISSAPLKEREYLGKKIYSMSLGGLPEEEDEEPGKPPRKEGEKPTAPKGNTFSFASSGGYVAFSTDEGMLEDYLRSGENPPKPLRGVAGFAEAAQKVGGMEGGFFSYENQAESFRITLEALRNDPEAVNSRLLSFAMNMGDGEENVFTRLFNPKLLPSYDRISKYFGFAIGAASVTPDGFVIKAATPRPAGLK